jgi:hypothetical protein
VTTPPARLPDALTALRDALAAAPLGLATPDRDAARRAARAVTDQIDDYLLPRLRDLDAPLLTVVGGSTGAGKSTLVNSLVGAPVTTAGVLRPTTRSPVLVCARADLPAFSGDRVLPGLPRVTGSSGGPGTVQLVARDDLPPGLALLDAPDVDSVVSCSRRPTSGSSSRRRPVTPTPSRGTCSGRRRSGAPRSPSSSTGCRPRRRPRWPPTWPGCCSGPGWPVPGCSSSRNGR